MAICSLLRIVPVAVFFAFLNWQPIIAATEPNRSASHRGKHFVLGFTAQIESLFYSGLNEISIYAFYDTYVNITLHKLRSARLRNKFIKAGDVLKYEIPTRMRMRSTMVDIKGILVTSTADVAVSCLSQVQFTSDSYLALPTARLGHKYVVASYAKTTLGIISTEDNTVVRIILNTNGILRYGRNLYRRGKKLVLKLNKLETFHIDHNADLSGTIIEANKAIAVLSGDKCAKVITQYCDHLIEFLLPVQTWGTEFVVATTGRMNKNSGDIYRVFAYENNTRVRSKDGNRLLQSGQFTEYDLGDELASFFECSKPCQVLQYIKGYLRAQDKEVDSSLLIVPSIDHFLNTYDVYLSGTKKNGFQHSVTLLTKSSERSGLQVNGRNTTSLQWQNIEGTKFSWTILQFFSKSTISHRSRSALFGALVFGEADYRSHGYPGGLNALLTRSVTAAWSRWSEWSECTASCNTGTQMRTRSCTGTNLILNDNRRCPGRDSETRECATWKCQTSCPSLGEIINGVMNSTDQKHGSTVQFTCHDGYQLIGASTARCDNGKWRKALPRCLAICRRISSIESGQVIGSGSLDGDHIRFVCDPNYVLIGEEFLRCTKTGNWSSPEPICKEKCSDPNESTNAKVIGNKFHDGKKVEFVCPQSYILVPKASSTLTCHRGIWNGVFPSCKASCASLGRMINGVINSTDQTHGSVVQFACFDGYGLIGATRAKCDDGVWTETLPQCLVICRKILSLENGMVIGSGNVEGDYIRFVCDTGYVLVGEKFLKCTNGGTWNASEPICKEMCSNPKKETNARVIGNELFDGKEVEFVCPQDVILFPETSRKLKCEKGVWNGKIPLCRASCPELSKLPNGLIRGQHREHGSLVKFICNNSYLLVGASTATCNNGKWSKELPNCLATCSEMSIIENGNVIGNGTIDGDEIAFVCDPNFMIVGEKVLRCTSAGSWNASYPNCERLCPDPSKDTSAKVIGDGFYNGREVEFQCPEDKVLIPETSRKLICENGSWNGIIPLCKASCPPLTKIPANGYANSGNRSHGSSIQFRCNNGHKLIGSSSINCYDGKWSEMPPKCLAFCREILYIKNGRILGGGSLEEDEISFICDEHYVLVGEKALRCTSGGRWNASEPKCKVAASWSRWAGWTDCTVSCDNGIQTRQRTCVGTNSVLNDNTLCRGKSLESRACASWKCPDCNKICTTGKLNNACDACICNDNTLTGVVKDNAGILLENATIALAEFPFKILAKTSVSGKFALKGFCISEDDIVVNREGYLPQTIRTTKINPTTAVVTAILKKIVFPEITAHPEGKLRLEGQPMTLCCAGTSSTDAKFEWMINDRGADEYQHDGLQSSKLIIPRVFKNMSGEIKCRVYDDHGAEFSDPAKIIVFNATDDSCDPTPSQQIVSLPQGCTEKETNSNSIDVGKCPKKKCIARGLKRMNDCKENFCCQRIATKKVRVNCLRHSFDMKKVTKCGCGECLVRQTVVKGVAIGGPENTPFKYGYIYHGEKYLTRTGRKGDFSFKVPGDFTRFVVTFKDKRGYNNFQELTKVIPLVPGRETFIEVRMKLRPEPIIVDAKEGFEIPLGNSRNTQRSRKSGNNVDIDESQLAPAVAFAVPPQGLMTEDGEIYNGTVKVEVNFVDPRNETEVEEADGDFTTVNEDGEQLQLETFGVIKMDFKDENDNRLQPKDNIDILLDINEYNITEKEAEKLQLWYMDEKTGRWRIMETALKKHKKKRSKRSDRTLYSASIDTQVYQQLLNIDSRADTCLFKVKVVDADEEDVGLQSVDITVYATQGILKRYITQSIPTNKAQCIETFCTQDYAIIRGSAMVGKHKEDLFPNDTGIHDDVKEKHGIVFPDSTKILDRSSYQITIDRLTKPLSNQPSPFYSDIFSCFNSPDEHSFSFMIPSRKKVEESKDFGDNWYPGIEASVCYVKIAVENINECPGKTASFMVESLSGDNNNLEGYDTISMTETSPTECAEYKCPQKDEVITVVVKALSPGWFTTDKSATKTILGEFGGVIYDNGVFLLKPIYFRRNLDIGILHSDEKVLTDTEEDKKEKKDICTGEQTTAGVRFACSIF